MITKSLNFNCIILILFIGFSSELVAKNKSDVSLEEASEFIRQQSQGKVLSAKTTHFNGARMHRIQVLTPSGRVKVFQVPAYKEPNKQSTDYIQNGSRYTQDRNKETKNYYQNNSNRTRNINRSTLNSRYKTPKTYSKPNNTTKGESKQK
jgi:hypothetical protein